MSARPQHERDDLASAGAGDREDAVEIEVLASDELDAGDRADLWRLWSRAFDDFTAHDADHAYGGVHVIARDDEIVAHASAVGRRLKFGDGPWRTVGYVEAVAVDPTRQRRGLGRLLMRTLMVELRARWSIAMLSTGRATGFYASLGWERWRGASLTDDGHRAVVDGEHGGLMILREGDAVPDLTLSVTCEDRPGDAW